MHFNVEKDLRNGLKMMKYIVNHQENFNNPSETFIICLMSTLVAQIIEFTVITVLTGMGSSLEIVSKYVALSALANV